MSTRQKLKDKNLTPEVKIQLVNSIMDSHKSTKSGLALDNVFEKEYKYWQSNDQEVAGMIKSYIDEYHQSFVKNTEVPKNDEKKKAQKQQEQVKQDQENADKLKQQQEQAKQDQENADKLKQQQEKAKIQNKIKNQLSYEEEDDDGEYGEVVENDGSSYSLDKIGESYDISQMPYINDLDIVINALSHLDDLLYVTKNKGDEENQATPTYIIKNGRIYNLNSTTSSFDPDGNVDKTIKDFEEQNAQKQIEKDNYLQQKEDLKEQKKTKTIRR